MAVSRRIEKMNSLLAREVANIFLTEMDFPADTVVTVAGVDTSPDLRYADVLISVLPANKTGSILSAVRKKIYKLQKIIDRRLAMRPVPKLRFSAMSSESGKLDKLFEEIKREP